jgi:hypothetical protein
MLLFSTSSLRLGVWWVIPGGLVRELGRRPPMPLNIPSQKLQLGCQGALSARREAAEF